MILLFLQVFLLAPCPVFAPADEGPAPGWVAEGRSVHISEEAYDAYLTSIYRRDPLGESLLQQLVRETAIRHTAEHRGLKVSARELKRKVAALERRLAAAGGPASLKEYIRAQEVDEDEFFDALRLSIAHERMVRHDFDIPDDREVPVEKLNLWLADLTGRIVVKQEDLPPGTAVIIDGERISDVTFGHRLRALLDKKDASRVLTEMIGIQVIRAKAKALGVSLTEEDVEEEIRYRTDRLHAWKGLESISFESFVQASEGKDLDAYKQSEKFRCELLLKKICDSLHHEAYLQDFFEKNRLFFENRYGRAVRLSTIFLKAVQFEDPLNRQVKTRSFEEAEEELKALKDRLLIGEVTFEEMARVYSEHASGKKGGDLGFIPVGIRGWEEITNAAWKAKQGTVLGPFRTPEGCHLVKITAKRDAVTYEAVRDKVKTEARRRYYQELIREAEVKRRF